MHICSGGVVVVRTVGVFECSRWQSWKRPQKSEQYIVNVYNKRIVLLVEQWLGWLQTWSLTSKSWLNTNVMLLSININIELMFKLDQTFCVCTRQSSSVRPFLFFSLLSTLCICGALLRALIADVCTHEGKGWDFIECLFYSMHWIDSLSCAPNCIPK